MNFPLDETLRIAKILDELEPYNLWHLASYLSLPDVYQRRNMMISKAKQMFATGELVKDGSRSRTFAGCFFAQITNEERKQAHRIRSTYRQSKKIYDKKYVPNEFFIGVQ